MESLAEFDGIDLLTFEQILEMDDDDDGEREFSRSIVYGFFEQAEGTFVQMEAALEQEDLDQLAALGHFLKGSANTLGAVNVRDGANRIKHYGLRKDEDGETHLQADACLDRTRDALAVLKTDYIALKEALRKFYDENAEDD